MSRIVIPHGIALGVNLRELLAKREVTLQSLGGKSIAIDAYNALYQFLAIIRQPDGTPLMDSVGRITSHLSGLLYRTSNLVSMGIRPVYIFDGAPPTLKDREIRKRSRIRTEARIKYERALRRGKVEEARVYAQATSRLKNYMVDDSKSLLELLGIPWVQAPSEGEAQAAHLVKRGDADYCASQDYDSLLFGAPRLVRNLTISGKRKLPRKRVYVEILPEIVELETVLEELGITHEQLIDVGILIGTDFNPEGIKGLGPKTSLELIRKWGTLERSLSEIEKASFPVEPQKIRNVFLHPEITDEYKVEWGKPDLQAVLDFMCKERDFSEDRVRKALGRISRQLDKITRSTTLEKWFG